MAKQEARRKPGRPKKQKVFSASELRAQTAKGMKLSRENRLGIKDLDVEQFCEEVLNITHRNKFTSAEIWDIKHKVEHLYEEFVTSKWEEDAKVFADVDKRIDEAIAMHSSRDYSRMSPEEWNRIHRLRPDGKRKPGPLPKTKKNIWDVEPGEAGTVDSPADPLDFEAMEVAWMEKKIAETAEQSKFLQGSRVRRGVNTRTAARSSRC